MPKIRIKNFGPIKEGCQENDGWIDIKKATLFIGNQGSGKSTMAKVIATMMWIEKALNRGDIQVPKSQGELMEYFKHQKLYHYFKDDTFIQYSGDCFEINFVRGNPILLAIKKADESEILDHYKVPKIMYVPADRNYLSSVINAYDVKGLPESLNDFAIEMINSMNALDNKEVPLPLGNGLKFQYDTFKQIGYVIGEDYKIRLDEAASGFHSFIPMYFVSKYLGEGIAGRIIAVAEQLTVNQQLKKSNELSKVFTNTDLNTSEKEQQVKRINARYENTCFINIVEEPEQNLFPTSQWEVLKILLAFNNLEEENKLIMTTHSPYIINHLTLSIKAASLRKFVTSNSLRLQLEDIVTGSAMVDADDLAIFEMYEVDGTISRLSDYNGLPSDDNYLNNSLAETNELFAQLLEFQQLHG